LTRENGQPNINLDQFRRMMNMIFVEDMLQGMSRIKTWEKVAFKYDTILFSKIL